MADDDTKQAYMICHTPTGVVDGYYFDNNPENVLAIANSWRERVPGHWTVFRVEREADQPKGYSRIMDHRFAANVFSLKDWTEKEVEALTIDIRAVFQRHAEAKRKKDGDER